MFGGICVGGFCKLCACQLYPPPTALASACNLCCVSIFVLRWEFRSQGDCWSGFSPCAARMSLPATRMSWFFLCCMDPQSPLRCAVWCTVPVASVVCCVVLAIFFSDPHVLCWLPLCGYLPLSLQGGGLLARLQAVVLRVILAFTATQTRIPGVKIGCVCVLPPADCFHAQCVLRCLIFS